MRRVLVALALLAIVASAAPATGTSARDGVHDFDFLNGDWTVTYSRLRHPLAHAHDWYSFPATSRVTPMWNGQGQVQDGDLHSPLGDFYGLTVRMYNPKTHQWSLYWGTTEIGVQRTPEIGQFGSDGIGLFYANDTFKGKNVIVRYKWWPDATHPHFEQSYSIDGGKTWEANWKSYYTRASSVPADNVPNGFAFLNGSWNQKYSRLRHPLAHAHDWYRFPGISSVRSMWEGRGQVEEGTLDSPLGKILGLTIRIQNPKTKKWELYWGTSELGMAAGPPQVGQFDANGVGIFDALDTWHGKSVIVRYKWTSDPKHPRFEQSFSSDHGETWETNWTTDYSRAGTPGNEAAT